MDCKEYWNKTLAGSSIHGFPYLVRRELHWLEKVFWGTIVVLATYFSIDICHNQWKRFRDNPIVYAMELAWGKSNFPFVGITLCTENADEEEIEHIIENVWGVTEATNATQYQYYVGFLKVLSSLNILNLDNLQPYENDSSLDDLKFMELLVHMNQKFIPAKQQPGHSENEQLFANEKGQTYAAAMTEVGLCRTTSQLTRYTNPFGDFESLKVNDIRFCDAMNECNVKIFPKVQDSGVLIFLHNVEDIVTPYDRGSIMRQASTQTSLTIELLLGLTTAETEVRNLPIAYRKCRYREENILKYFEFYRPGLCRIECRINAAMQKCACKPFFYVVAPQLPVCNIKGMQCLARQHWPQVAQCNCPKLCEEETYISMQSTLQKDESTKFESTIIVKLFLPHMAIKRRVVFSTDQLLMSFGGAIGLFLGASFISVYGLLYVLSVYVFGNMYSCYSHRNSNSRRTKEQQITLVRRAY